MIRIKSHGMYDHFEELRPKEGEKYIECFSDWKVGECMGPGDNFALMLEPRSMFPPYILEYVEKHPDYFKYIFTHDSKLLKLKNARLLSWADVWLTTDSEKTEGISLITSKKDWCDLHKARLELAKFLEHSHPEVNVFWGDWDMSVIPYKPKYEARDYLEHYMFSIVIENYIDDYWYTEKLLNCFATKTVPIYVGARKINEIFNAEGIIRVDDCANIPDLLNFMEGNLDVIYQGMKDAIEDNFKRVEPWKTPWKQRFFRDYGDLLEDMMNE